MNRLSMIYRWLPVFFSILVFNGCSYAEPSNLGLLRQTIETYHDSGAYEQELNYVSQQAIAFINMEVAKNQQRQHPKKLAIVLDIDETSLSYYSRMVPRQFVGTNAQFEQEVLEADAPALKPTLKIYQDALEHGVAVFFVTGRRAALRDATEKNLKNAGYTRWTSIYFKPNDYTHTSITPFKKQMRELISKKGYSIIANIGDQFSDLKGGYAVLGFKLPNPYYFLP